MIAMPSDWIFLWIDLALHSHFTDKLTHGRDDLLASTVLLSWKEGKNVS